MNRQNFLAHLALALTIVLVAGFAGQLRRWETESRAKKANKLPTAEKVQPPAQSPRQASVLVKFRSSESRAEIDGIVTAKNDEILDRIESLNDQLVSIEDHDGADPATVAASYRALENVEYAEVDNLIQLDQRETGQTRIRSVIAPHSQTPNDPQFAEEWGLENTGQRGGTAEADVRAALAWTATQGDREVVVAVLDSGVDYTHPDLVQNMWMRPDNMPLYFDDELGYANDDQGFNAVDNSADPMDDNGHGTHCAGIIGAEGDNNLGIAGVNWHVQIMPLKFIGPSGSGTTKDAIEAINYVIERKRAGVNIRVISASWGSTQYSKALEDVIREAGEAGILFVAAAGNASTDNDRTPHYPSSFDLPNVISVAATDRNDELTSFSNFGVKSVHIAAPGAEVLSTWLGSGFEEHSGTSMAAPVVSGVAALVIAIDPNISLPELRATLMASVDKMPQLKGKVESGGRINAAKAVGVN